MSYKRPRIYADGICRHGQFSPNDSTTYYFGAFGTAPSTAATSPERSYIPIAGRIRKILLHNWVSAVNGSNEAFSSYLRLNSTTDYEISAAMDWSPDWSYYTKTVDIPVIVGDYFEGKYVTPTWVTNPTGVYGRLIIIIEHP